MATKIKVSSSQKAGRRKGGRPSSVQAAKLKDKILDAAADVFFSQGYGGASIEAIANRARIAKRTLYSRFRDKAELFEAVFHHVVDSLRPANVENIFRGTGTEVLHHLAETVLHAALNPRALALHRLMIADASRFPELADVIAHVGTREEAVKAISGLLEQEIRLKNISLNPNQTIFAAEQFLQMIVSVPQRRAMVLGKPMTPHELDEWAHNTVMLFLNGCKGSKE